MHYTEWIDDDTNEVIINIGFNKGTTYLENTVNLMNAELRALRNLRYLYKHGLYKGNCKLHTVNTKKGLTGIELFYLPIYYQRLDIYNKILENPSLTIESFFYN